MSSAVSHNQNAPLSDSWKQSVIKQLLDKTPDNEIVENLKQKNVAEALVRAEIQAIRQQSAFQAAVVLTAQIKKHESIAIIQHQLAQLSPQNGKIERRSNLSHAEFVEKYYSRNYPVILTGMMDHWRAPTRWTAEYLKATCGDEMVEITADRNKNPQFEIEFRKHVKTVRFADYIDMVESPSETNDYYLTARNGFFLRPGLKTLLDDIDLFSDFLDPKAKEAGHFWYGPKGTITPFHHDGLNIFLAQVQGRKRVKMVPLTDLDFMYNHTAVYTLIDAENPDLTRFPKFKDARVTEIDLAPGEVLFIPTGWWHHVRALDKSISLSFTKFNLPNNYAWANPELGDGASAYYDEAPKKATIVEKPIIIEKATAKAEIKPEQKKYKTIDARWQAWVKENLERKCNPDDVYSMLVKRKFDMDEIRSIMGDSFPEKAPVVQTGEQASADMKPQHAPKRYTPRLDKNWDSWVQENLARNCAPEGIVEILLKNSFSIPAIRRSMADKFPANSVHFKPFPPEDPIWLDTASTNIDHKALSILPIEKLLKNPNTKLIETNQLQLLTVDHFLTDEECDKLADITNKHLRPSTVTVYVEGFRTSMTCELSSITDPIVTIIDNKIADALGINPSFSEGIQAQKYAVGQEFKAHTDYFAPGTKEFEAHARVRGNRTWTFMIYLNDCPKGGGTQFVNLHKTFYPKKGTAVVWNSLYDDGTPNPDSLHWGMPIEEGEKFVITKWFRENGTGKMFPENQ